MNFSGIWILVLKYLENEIWEQVSAYQKSSVAKHTYLFLNA